MTPLERADEAEQVLKNPVLTKAFEDIREGLVKRLESSPMGDVDTQHEIALTLQVLKQVKQTLVSYIGEKTIVEHRKKQDSFIDKIREKYA